jgi:hypothetical protein
MELVYRILNGNADRSGRAVYGRSLAGTAVSNTAGAWMFVSCECRVLSGRGLCVWLITRVESPTGCGVSEHNREASLRWPWPTRGCCATGKKKCENTYLLCVFSGVRREVDENCALPGYYVASSGNFVPTFRGNLSVPSSSVKKMGLIACLEKSVRNYHYSLRNNPEERSSHVFTSKRKISDTKKLTS